MKRAEAAQLKARLSKLNGLFIYKKRSVSSCFQKEIALFHLPEKNKK